MLKAHSNNNKVFFQHLNNIKQFLLPLRNCRILTPIRVNLVLNNLQIKFLNIIL